jgi:hypothetical protein
MHDDTLAVCPPADTRFHIRTFAIAATLPPFDKWLILDAWRIAENGRERASSVLISARFGRYK